MPVHIAAKLKDFDAFRADYSTGDETRLFAGKPLLFYALSNNKPQPRYEIAKFLLDRGALVAGTNDEGDGALSILLSRQARDIPQTTELVQALLAAGADPRTRDARGVTPTQWIARLPEADAEIAELLDVWFALPGLAPDAPNDLGKTPIELAGDFPQRADRVRRMKEYRA